MYIGSEVKDEKMKLAFYKRAKNEIELLEKNFPLLMFIK